MDTKDLQTLELSAVLEQLANRAAFSASKDLARSLIPSDDIEQVSSRLAETTSQSAVRMTFAPWLKQLHGALSLTPRSCSM
jgi:dsDNA-specific endonuclease/ATPase MutS2